MNWTCYSSTCKARLQVCSHSSSAIRYSHRLDQTKSRCDCEQLEAPLSESRGSVEEIQLAECNNRCNSFRKSGEEKFLLRLSFHTRSAVLDAGTPANSAFTTCPLLPVVLPQLICNREMQRLYITECTSGKNLQNKLISLERDSSKSTEVFAIYYIFLPIPYKCFTELK